MEGKAKLLGGMLARELDRTPGRIDAVTFYVRRWFRILPAYASSMLIQMLVIANDRERHGCPSLWWSNLFFINSSAVNLSTPQ